MIFFTEIGKNDSEQNIIFQFYQKELPEEIAFGREVKLNEVKYPGGFQTNQIMGVFEKEVEWTGVFFGTYFDGDKTISAKERADLVYALMGRPLRVYFPVPGHEKNGQIPGIDIIGSGPRLDSNYGGFKGIYVIKEFDPKIRNYSHIEYTIKLVPHQRQEKVKPYETTNVLPKPSIENVQVNATKLINNIKPGSPQTAVNAAHAGQKGMDWSHSAVTNYKTLSKANDQKLGVKPQ